MIEFANRNELRDAFTVYAMQVCGMDKVSAAGYAEGRLKYAPHLYRGGWVIPNFGYSTERLGLLDGSWPGSPEGIQ